MPEKKTTSKTAPAPAKTTRSKPEAEPVKLTATAPAEPSATSPAKPRTRKPSATKMEAGKAPADQLILTPPAEKDIIIKTNAAETRRRTSGTTGSSSRSRSSTGSTTTRRSNTTSSTRRTPPPQEIEFEDFHQSDRLPPISDATRQEITGIVLIVAGLILFLGMLANEGLVAQIGLFARRLCGIGAFIIPPLIILMGATYIWEGLTQRERFNQARLTGVIFMLIAFIAVIHLVAGNSKDLADSGGGGGYIAYYINSILGGIVTPVGVLVLWAAFFLVGMMLALSMSLRDMGRAIQNTWRWVRGAPPLVAGETLDAYGAGDDLFDDEFGEFENPVRRGRGRALPEDDDDLLDELLLNGSGRAVRARKSLVPEPPENQYTHTIKLDETVARPAAPETSGKILASGEPTPPVPAPMQVNVPPPSRPEKGQRPLQQNWQRDEGTANPQELPSNREWQIPNINILASFSDVEVNPQELRKKARLIENTLSSFGIEAWVREVNTGPTVTQFALEPGMGVKVARITALANDLALALAAPSIRLEAPVPGQSRVGIEVPNAKVATVGLREIMETDEFTHKSGRLKFALGRDVSGQPVAPDLAKMPHLLIAGSTGSGKSVCLNSIVAAYLLQYRPSELQFIMIDPKMVELSTYNGIPHLRFPVVTQIEADPENERNRNDRTPTVMSVLKWTIREMEKRYKTLSMYGHRNIESFNKAAGAGHPLEKLPYLVLIVDELADLMMVAPEEAESAICRLAQKARAVGIHLILATQRPSVDVVTGLIKANFPSRITFAVTSQIDSRVILDMAGAEKLLGRGDMLYLASDAAKPMRVQGVYVGDDEIDTLVKHWRQQFNFLNGQKTDFVQNQLWPDELQQIEAENAAGESDELFEQALEIVREARSASTSLLQRRLRVGYNRAARLIEELAEAGVIGPAEGGKPRPVLLAEEDLGDAQSLTAAANDFTPVPPAPARPPIEAATPAPASGRQPAVTFGPPPEPGAPIKPRQNLPPEPLPPLPAQRPPRPSISGHSADFDPDPPI